MYTNFICTLQNFSSITFETYKLALNTLYVEHPSRHTAKCSCRLRLILAPRTLNKYRFGKFQDVTYFRILFPHSRTKVKTTVTLLCH